MSEINWKPRYLLGRLASGRELGKDKTVHAVPVADGWRALCGVRPGPRSAGWTENTDGLVIDCMRCLNVISMDATKLAQQSPPQLMNEIDAAYIQGIALGAAWLCKVECTPTVAKNLLVMLGVSSMDLQAAKVPSVDLEVLLPLFKKEKSK